MTITQFVKQDPERFGILIFVIFLFVVIVPFLLYTGNTNLQLELEIIDGASCYELKEMILNKELFRTMNDAKHVYEWRCEK